MKYILSLLLLFTASSAFADSTCSSTKYVLLNNTVSFGMTIEQAKSALERKYKGKANVLSPKEGFLVVAFHNPQNNVSRMVLFAINGKITRQLFTYSDQFIRKFGGNAEMFVAMVGKLTEKYGERAGQSFDQDEDKATFNWSRQGGATLQVMASKSTVDLRIDCDDLEDQIKAQTTKSANFGF